MRGGYREGSGRSKSGYYRSIYCGSTYELCWVIYSIDHNVKFKRFPSALKKDGITYYPDFLLADNKTIVETKGYEKQDLVDKKSSVAISLGYDVIVLRKNDLKYAFDYVKEKYGTSKYYTLFDAYKPLYSYTCSYCKILFETDIKRKTKEKFCNQSCAGKFRNSHRVMTDELKKRISDKLIGKSIKPYKRKYKQIWITNGKIITRINAELSIPDGFKRGRKYI